MKRTRKYSRTTKGNLTSRSREKRSGMSYGWFDAPRRSRRFPHKDSTMLPLLCRIWTWRSSVVRKQPSEYVKWSQVACTGSHTCTWLKWCGSSTQVHAMTGNINDNQRIGSKSKIKFKCIDKFESGNLHWKSCREHRHTQAWNQYCTNCWHSEKDSRTTLQAVRTISKLVDTFKR